MKKGEARAGRAEDGKSKEEQIEVQLSKRKDDDEVILDPSSPAKGRRLCQRL